MHRNESMLRYVLDDLYENTVIFHMKNSEVNLSSCFSNRQKFLDEFNCDFEKFKEILRPLIWLDCISTSCIDGEETIFSLETMDVLMAGRTKEDLINYLITEIKIKNSFLWN